MTSDDDKEELIIVADSHTLRKVPTVLMARGTTDSNRECRFCRIPTVRTIAFKAPVTAPAFDLVWCCDYCLEAIRTMAFNNEGR